MFCDYDNVHWINEEFRFVKFNLGLCNEIVRNTIEYYMYFKDFVWKYINTVSMLAHCVADPDSELNGNF